MSLLSKHFEDLENFLSLLKHSSDIIGISEHIFQNTLLFYLVYLILSCFNATEIYNRETGFFVSNKLTYKLPPDLIINEHERLESTDIELILNCTKKHYFWYHL